MGRNIMETNMLDKLLTFKEVGEITGLHPSSLRRKANNPDDPFPRFYTYSTRYSRFKESEIEAWINNLKPNRDPK